MAIRRYTRSRPDVQSSAEDEISPRSGSALSIRHGDRFNYAEPESEPDLESGYARQRRTWTMRSVGRSGGRGGRALEDRDGGGDDDVSTPRCREGGRRIADWLILQRSYEPVNQDDDEYEYRSDKKQGSRGASDDSDTGGDSNGRSQAKRDTDGSHSQSEGSDGDYSSQKAGAGGRGSDTDDDEQTTPKHAHGGDAEKEESALKKYKWWWIGAAMLALIVVVGLSSAFPAPALLKLTPRLQIALAAYFILVGPEECCETRWLQAHGSSTRRTASLRALPANRPRAAIRPQARTARP